jgi:hypothetical protein
MSGKKRIAVCAVAVTVIAVLVLIFAIAANRDGKAVSTAATEHFRTPDYTLDISSVSGYMDKDRFITYAYGAEAIGLDESNQNSFGKGVSFFIDYFQTLINGDVDGYNALFSDEYYKSADPLTSFTKQMIYDQRVEKISESVSGSVTEYVFAVTYRIYENDGTFRKEIGSDGAKVQYFYLSDGSGEVLIDKVTDSYE